MPTLREIQLQFVDYLAAGKNSIVAYVDGPDEQERVTRLNIYRNAYLLRLKECIDKDHGILGRYLGDDLFDRLCREFVDEYPSVYISLRHFCDRLPGYLKSAHPFRDIPVLAELASFERCLMFSFDAAESSVATLSDLRQIPAPDWPTLGVDFHPSVNTLIADWNSVAIWQALKEDQQPPVAIRHTQIVYWLIWRGIDRLTQFRAIEHDAFVLYAGLQKGESLAECCEKLVPILPENSIGPRVAEHLDNWVIAGLVSNFNCKNGATYQCSGPD